MAQIIFDNLAVGYDGHIVASGMNLEVEGGSYLCIVGENGAGKSTLVKTFLNLKKPIEGKIIFGDGLKSNEIGYLPQQTVVQRDFPASVREIVISGTLNKCGLRPFYGAAEKKLASENMEKLGISHLAKRCYRELSGGQQQRVLLARALCATSKLLVLDEPVAGLDPSATREMYEIIYKLNQEDKITVIMVSHDLDAALEYASHILHISHEQTVFSTTKEYLESELGKRFTSKGGYENV